MTRAEAYCLMPRLVEQYYSPSTNETYNEYEGVDYRPMIDWMESHPDAVRLLMPNEGAD